MFLMTFFNSFYFFIRYLRDKLSSPERKKPTPAEAKRRLDERHTMADLKRASRDSERANRLRLKVGGVLSAG
jgi:hypothetical protein